MSNFMLDVGQANELKLAFRRHDGTAVDLKWLVEGQNLADVLAVRRGKAIIRHLIDCSIPPQMKDAAVVEHKNTSVLEWNPDRVKLVSYAPSFKGKSARDIRQKLDDQLVLNAAVCMYLQQHQYLIPEEWCGHAPIQFLGTLYRDRHSEELYAPSLIWSPQAWEGVLMIAAPLSHIVQENDTASAALLT